MINEMILSGLELTTNELINDSTNQTNNSKNYNPIYCGHMNIQDFIKPKNPNDTGYLWKNYPELDNNLFKIPIDIDYDNIRISIPRFIPFNRQVPISQNYNPSRNYDFSDRSFGIYATHFKSRRKKSVLSDDMISTYFFTGIKGKRVFLPIYSNMFECLKFGNDHNNETRKSINVELDSINGYTCNIPGKTSKNIQINFYINAWDNDIDTKEYNYIRDVAPDTQMVFDVKEVLDKTANKEFFFSRYNQLDIVAKISNPLYITSILNNEDDGTLKTRSFIIGHMPKKDKKE